MRGPWAVLVRSRPSGEGQREWLALCDEPGWEDRAGEAMREMGARCSITKISPSLAALESRAGRLMGQRTESAVLCELIDPPGLWPGGGPGGGSGREAERERGELLIERALAAMGGSAGPALSEELRGCWRERLLRAAQSGRMEEQEAWAGLLARAQRRELMSHTGAWRGVGGGEGLEKERGAL